MTDRCNPGTLMYTKILEYNGRRHTSLQILGSLSLFEVLLRVTMSFIGEWRGRD